MAAIHSIYWIGRIPIHLKANRTISDFAFPYQRMMTLKALRQLSSINHETAIYLILSKFYVLSAASFQRLVARVQPIGYVLLTN